MVSASKIASETGFTFDMGNVETIRQLSHIRGTFLRHIQIKILSDPKDNSKESKESKERAFVNNF